MKKGNYLSALLRSNHTVFSVLDAMLIWEETNPELSRSRLNYYIRKGELYQIRRGFYAKDSNYDKFELGTKIFTPSYISFETVLGKAGITFQSYSQIKLASYLTRDIQADSQSYSYKKLKKEIITNHLGIKIEKNYSIAIPERAFLDVLYLNTSYHFDNLGPLDWDRVDEIIPIYGNKRLENTITRYKKQNI